MNVELGGVPLDTENGAPQQEYGELGGSNVGRRSGGRGVPMTHWSKTAITISGSGMYGAALHGLDFTQPLELRCTQPLELSTTELAGTVSTDIRPDVSPWAWALVDGERIRAPITRVAGTRDFVLTAVPDAARYIVCWMPVFIVKASRPTRSWSAVPGELHAWTLTAEEL